MIAKLVDDLESVSNLAVQGPSDNKLCLPAQPTDFLELFDVADRYTPNRVKLSFFSTSRAIGSNLLVNAERNPLQ